MQKNLFRIKKKRGYVGESTRNNHKDVMGVYRGQASRKREERSGEDGPTRLALGGGEKKRK